MRGEEVLIVDSFSGRVLEGRRYSDGLHQSIEAKEGELSSPGAPLFTCSHFVPASCSRTPYCTVTKRASGRRL